MKVKEIIKRVQDTLRLKPIRYCLRVVYVLIFIWFILCGVAILLDSAVAVGNTASVREDPDKVLVSQVLEDTVRLSTGREVDMGSISEYIRVSYGEPIYYYEEGILTAPYSILELLPMGIRFVILGIIVFIMFLVILRRVLMKKGRRDWRFISLMCSYGIVSIFITLVCIAFSSMCGYGGFYVAMGYLLVSVCLVALYMARIRLFRA